MYRGRDQSSRELHRSQYRTKKSSCNCAPKSVTLGGSKPGINGKDTRCYANDRGRRVRQKGKCAVERQSDKYSGKVVKIASEKQFLSKLV